MKWNSRMKLPVCRTQDVQVLQTPWVASCSRYVFGTDKMTQKRAFLIFRTTNKCTVIEDGERGESS